MTKKIWKNIVLATLIFLLALMVYVCFVTGKEELAVKNAFRRAEKKPHYIYLKKADTILGNFGVLPAASINDINAISIMGRRIDWFFENDSIDYWYLNCPFKPENLIEIGISNYAVYYVEKYMFSDSSFVLCSRFDTVCWKKTSFIVDKRCVHKDSVPEEYIKIVEDFWYNNMSEQTKIYYKLRPHLLKKAEGNKYGFGCVCKHKWKEFWE